MNNNNKNFSKFLSYVLRHQPDSIGITLDAQGWTEIATLMSQAAKHGKRFKLEDLHEAVSTSDKQRFALSEDGLRIRANQGHSVAVDLALPVSVPPDVLYHGTASRFIASIMKDGLHPGSRHHVHLSANTTTARTVGARHGMPVILQVMAKQMQEDGIQFFVSANGVWLCDSVPPKYLIRTSDDN
ncbi:RNA 2'-phosphotransferase [Undibacterium sp. TC9W]|uniref:RNA 2'-phosphotransferase n=1 Tax=Undibacterium sp. TC9W TaxID=3413053 RepID=UPI003BF05B4D